MFKHITQDTRVPVTLVMTIVIVSAAMSIGFFLPDFLLAAQAVPSLSCKAGS